MTVTPEELVRAAKRRSTTAGKWWLATDEWLDARLNVASAGGRQAECGEIEGMLRRRAGENFAIGSDQRATVYRELADELVARRKRLVGDLKQRRAEAVMTEADFQEVR